MKPVIRLVFGKWICVTHPSAHAPIFGTAAETPFKSWDLWFQATRSQASGIIDEILLLPSRRMFRRSMLARKTLGLIEHDRYLLKVDSRQPGGKGNM